METPSRKGGVPLLAYHAAYPIIVAAAVVLSMSVGLRAVDDGVSQSTREHLGSVVRIVANTVPATVWANHRAAETFCRSVARNTRTRITLIAGDGTVLGDSHAPAREMENHRTRPEIAAALQGRDGFSRRYSVTLADELVYAAIPVPTGPDGTNRAVVRVALTAADVEGPIGVLRSRLLWLGVLLVPAAIVLTVLVSEAIGRPIRLLDRAAGQGHPDSSDMRRAPRELERLARTLSRMASNLRGQVTRIDAQRRETEAVLNAIRDPLVLVDTTLTITRVNDAALGLAGVRRTDAEGRNLLTVFRSSEIERFVRGLLDDSSESRETGVTLYESGERHLLVWGAPMRAHGGSLAGHVLVVIRDITPEIRLEQTRRDFVSNVSHELKTPLTSVRGAVETLLDLEEDSQDEPSVRNTRSRFLEMVRAGTARMEATVEDLLRLARIERAEETAHRATVPLRQLLVSVVEQIAGERPVAVDCDPGLTASLSESLMRRAVENLLANAVAYTPPDGAIRVYAERREGQLEIAVADTGIGIPRSEQERVFERFYRVDAARERRTGGTGLGLSIVQHIARAHGGTVSVESAPGQGSTFSILIPGDGQ